MLCLSWTFHPDLRDLERWKRTLSLSDLDAILDQRRNLVTD
jgi:hypothetical protein